MVVTGDYNYSDPVTQAQIENFTQVLENTSYVSNTLYTESWLRSFLQYVERNNDYLNVTIGTETEFIQALKEVINTKFVYKKSNCIFASFLLAMVVPVQSIFFGCEI